MQPTANTDEIEHDFRYGMLVKELTASKMPHEEAYYLHRWLSDAASRQMQQQAIAKGVGIPTFTEKIRACTKLEKSASAVAEMFDFLHQFSALEFTMSQVFNSLQQDSATHPSQSEHWRTFRERFTTDAALLAEIATQTITEIRARERKQKGRRSKEWRNSLVLELVDYFAKLSGYSQEKCISLTCNVCEIYFPDDSVKEPESIQKIVTRKRRKLQGQN